MNQQSVASAACEWKEIVFWKRLDPLGVYLGRLIDLVFRCVDREKTRAFHSVPAHRLCLKLFAWSSFHKAELHVQCRFRSES
jgi:hypothetical protein